MQDAWGGHDRKTACHLAQDLPCYSVSESPDQFLCGGVSSLLLGYNSVEEQWCLVFLIQSLALKMGVGTSNGNRELFKRTPGFHSVLLGRFLFKILSSIYTHRSRWNKRLSIESPSSAEELLKFHLVFFFFFHKDVTWSMVKSNIIIVGNVTGP